ncbi:hypothetical protein BC567DRAFT_224069 [Phyllosticta citribraziliensis]
MSPLVFAIGSLAYIQQRLQARSGSSWRPSTMRVGKHTCRPSPAQVAAIEVTATLPPWL